MPYIAKSSKVFAMLLKLHEGGLTVKELSDFINEHPFVTFAVFWLLFEIVDLLK